MASKMATKLEIAIKEDFEVEPTDDYYTVIDIPNAKDVYRESGWPIHLGKELKDKINKIETLQNIKSLEQALSVKQACDIGKEMFCLDNKIAVSVVGLFNRGKTFLLNLITGMGLPAGKKFTTKGLSIAIPHDKTVAQSLYVIDTEGSNASLSKGAIKKALESLQKECPFEYKTPDPELDPNIEFNEASQMKQEREREYGEFYNKAKERAIVEKLATEQLLSEIILRLAEVLIVVVNEMTWDDQQFIESLTKQLEINKNLKFRLIVIHNYKETTSYEEFIEMRKKYVKSCSYGAFEKKTIVGQKDPVEVFVTKSSPEILHGFLAKDGSDLGNAINPLTIQWIQQVCNSTQRSGAPEFIPKLISCATESLANLVNVAGNMRLHYDPSDKKFLLKSVSDNPKLINDVVEASRRHVTIQASTFEIVYDILEVGERFLVTVDLPGYSSERTDRIGTILPAVDPIKNTLTLKGTRTLYTSSDSNVCYPEKDGVANIVSRHRKGGDFFCQIQLPNYVKPDVVAKWSHGSLTLSFPIIQRVASEQNFLSV